MLIKFIIDHNSTEELPPLQQASRLLLISLAAVASQAQTVNMLITTSGTLAGARARACGRSAATVYFNYRLIFSFHAKHYRNSTVSAYISFAFCAGTVVMGKIHIICSTCGSKYIITSQLIEKVDKGSVSCYSCNTSLFEYDGCVSYYPLLVTQTAKKIIDGLETDAVPNVEI